MVNIELMENVTKSEFWAFVMSTKLNIHPRAERERVLWVNQASHEVIAVETPGYTNKGEESYKVNVAACGGRAVFKMG